LDSDGLRAALWTIYWRGTDDVRRRIEGVLDPTQRASRQPAVPEPVNAAFLCHDVREFVRLARAGAYMAGSRDVSRQERSAWRFEFKRLVEEALRAVQQGALDHGGAALELLLDLAVETGGRDYFHSEDPVEAMKLVVSDCVEVLWGQLRACESFDAFCSRAADHLCRWESRFGWTRTGYGKISEKERMLADVLGGMLQGVDAWAGMAKAYVAALDRRAAGTPAPAGRRDDAWQVNYQRSRLADQLAHWHGMLLAHLMGTDAEPLLDRIAGHRAFSGPYPRFLSALLAQKRGESSRARELIVACLAERPGCTEFQEFATALA
jgi:hypothetical protein